MQILFDIIKRSFNQQFLSVKKKNPEVQSLQWTAVGGFGLSCEAHLSAGSETWPDSSERHAEAPVSVDAWAGHST